MVANKEAQDQLVSLRLGPCTTLKVYENEDMNRELPSADMIPHKAFVAA